MARTKPKPRGVAFYQAAFFHFEGVSDDELRARAISRAEEANRVVIGEVTLNRHRLSYDRAPELDAEVVIATVEVRHDSRLFALGYPRDWAIGYDREWARS